MKQIGTMTRLVAVALIIGNVAAGLMLARPAEASAAFGCALGPEKCACIESMEVCSHVDPLGPKSCKFQSDCNITY